MEENEYIDQKNTIQDKGQVESSAVNNMLSYNT